MTGDSTPLLMSILQGAHASLSVLHLSLGCASLCLAYIKTSHLMSDVLIILTSTCTSASGVQASAYIKTCPAMIADVVCCSDLIGKHNHAA